MTGGDSDGQVVSIGTQRADPWFDNVGGVVFAFLQQAASSQQLLTQGAFHVRGTDQAAGLDCRDKLRVEVNWLSCQNVKVQGCHRFIHRIREEELLGGFLRFGRSTAGHSGQKGYE